MTRPGLVLAFLLVSTVVSAQTDADPSPVPVGIATDDTAFAVDRNPALLPFVPRYSIVASHSRTVGRADPVVTTNVALAFARRGFGAGLGFDRVDYANTGRGRFSFALAYAASRRFSVGMALRVVGPNAVDAGATGLDLAAVVRPSTFLSFAIVANDLLGPLGLDANGARDTPARFGGYVGLRPFGTEQLTFEAGFLTDTDARLTTRLYGASAFAPWGRVYVVGLVDDLAGDPYGSVLAGLELRFGGLGVGGAFLGDGQGALGFLAHASIDGRAGSGLVERRRVVDLDLDGSVSSRELTNALLVLDHARIAREVEGAVVRLRGTGIGLARAQELRHAIQGLVEADEPVTCVLESPSGAELYACGTATETFVEESGTVRLLGPSIELVTYGGLLETLGVHADFVKIGAYKTAPERFTNREPSAESIAQTTTFVDDVYARLVRDLAGDLSVGDEVVRRAIDRGPLSAADARAVGFVDGSIDTTEVEQAVHRLHGGAIRLEPDTRPAATTWSVAPRIAVVQIDGMIVDGESVSIPFLGSRATGADTLVETLEALRHDATVRAVVLRIESPGGSSTASERIWRAVRRVAAEKPVIASLGSVAASGGFYIATAASTIYADPSTLTGSIGIYYGKIDVATLASRLGVGIHAIERGEHAGATSMFRPLDEGERARLEELVREGYDLFVRRVADGRHRTVESLEGLCEGRIWSGDRARENGLVDRLGGLVAALAHARQLGDVDDDVDVVVLPELHVGLVERLVGGSMGEVTVPLARLAALAPIAFGPTEGMFALAPFDEGIR